MNRPLAISAQGAAGPPGSPKLPPGFSSRAMRLVLAMIRKIAGTNCTVLLLGETGVGKNVVASLIHQLSLRASRKFVEINCGAIADSLFESEVFGYVKGAANGLTRDKDGYFKAANGGTLFANEIGELSTARQVKLLTAVENKEVIPVGAVHPIPTDVRLIAATNIDLDVAVAQGRFRADLFYRLSAFPIVIPPLRERPEDLDELADYFLVQASKVHVREGVRLDPAARQLLHSHRWPGNVRQLKNVIERAVVLSDSNCLIPDDLASLNVGASQVNHEVPPNTPPVSDAKGELTRGLLELSWEELEELYLRELIALFNGRLSSVAKRAGLSMTTLERRLRSWREREASLEGLR